MRQCEIYLHGIKCGLLTEEDDKSFTFSYDSVYLQRESVLLRIDPDDDFGILLATCQTDTIGAITVKPIRL